MKTDEKNIGPQKNRPDKVRVEDLLGQIADAVATSRRDDVFDLAARLVTQLSENPLAQIGDDEDLLPLPTVANQLDCGERTVWRLVASGELSEPVHVRGSARWFRRDIRAYMARITTERDKRRK